jgi:predicted  nucleic acid-binding Zn-ribbon protein
VAPDGENLAQLRQVDETMTPDEAARSAVQKRYEALLTEIDGQDDNIEICQKNIAKFEAHKARLLTDADSLEKWLKDAPK